MNKKKISFEHPIVTRICCDFDISRITARRLIECIANGGYAGLSFGSGWERSSLNPPPKDGTRIWGVWDGEVCDRARYWSEKESAWMISGSGWTKVYRTQDPECWMLIPVSIGDLT